MESITAMGSPRKPMYKKLTLMYATLRRFNTVEVPRFVIKQCYKAVRLLHLKQKRGLSDNHILKNSYVEKQRSYGT